MKKLIILTAAAILAACAPMRTICDDIQDPAQSAQCRIQMMQAMQRTWVPPVTYVPVPPPQIPQQRICNTVPNGYGGFRTVCY